MIDVKEFLSDYFTPLLMLTISTIQICRDYLIHDEIGVMIGCMGFVTANIIASTVAVRKKMDDIWSEFKESHSLSSLSR